LSREEFGEAEGENRRMQPLLAGWVGLRAAMRTEGNATATGLSADRLQMIEKGTRQWRLTGRDILRQGRHLPLPDSLLLEWLFLAPPSFRA
jgi:hypothetical protein